jgi:P4 family phage/plasmid primase-like protien
MNAPTTSTDVPVEAVAIALGLAVLRDGSSVRCACPATVHQHDHERPECSLGGENPFLFFCRKCGASGDAVTFIKLVLACGDREAFDWLRSKGFIADKECHGTPAPPDPVAGFATLRDFERATLDAYQVAPDADQITLPERDDKGVVTGQARRRGDGKPYPGGAKQLFTKGMHRGLIYAPELLAAGAAAGEPLLPCEGWPDSFRLTDCGHRAVVGLPSATPGRVVLQYLSKLVGRLGFKRAVIFYDPGPSGKTMLSKVAPVLVEAGLDVSVVAPVGDDDIDSRLRKLPRENRSAPLARLIADAAEWTPATPTATADAPAGGGPQACPVFDDNGRPIPLGVAQEIHRRHKNLVSVRGDFFDFTGKVFESVETVVIDADAVAIIGGHARRSNLGDTRHLLTVAVHRPNDFFDNADQNYLHLENGALNIEKLMLEAHDPKFRALNLLPVAFDPSADCPRFKKALQEWLPGDVGAQELLMEFAGYCLIKDVSLELMIFLVGEGGNGKGRFLHVLEILLGKRNISGLPLAALRAERTFPITALVGKLLNICPESEFSTDLDEGIIKSLVSGDPLEIERKGRDAFLFHNKARFIVQSNNPPHINDKSNAFWRRLIVIRFNATFSQAQVDTSLDAKLASELPGILNLALAGLHRLAARGRFNPTPNMLAELTSYRRECNPLATWREDRLIDAEPAWTGRPAWVSCADAYENYRSWCKENGHVSYSRAKFTRELKRLGLEHGVFRDDAGRLFKGFTGVSINEP